MPVHVDLVMPRRDFFRWPLSIHRVQVLAPLMKSIHLLMSWQDIGWGYQGQIGYQGQT